jgi:hypothetical protein
MYVNFLYHAFTYVVLFGHVFIQHDVAYCSAPEACVLTDRSHIKADLCEINLFQL